MRKAILFLALMLLPKGMMAQDVDTNLARHNFFYAGQSKQRRMFIVKDGKVEWSYQDQGTLTFCYFKYGCHKGTMHVLLKLCKMVCTY